MENDNKEQVNVRMKGSYLKIIDELAEEQSKAKGEKITRSGIINYLCEKALDDAYLSGLQFMSLKAFEEKYPDGRKHFENEADNKSLFAALKEVNEDIKSKMTKTGIITIGLLS